MMKLYSVSVRWKNKYERKTNVCKSIIMAETKEEAVKKFEEANSNVYPDGLLINIYEVEDGIYTLGTKRI